MPGLLCIQSPFLTPLLGAGNFTSFDTLSQTGGGHLASVGGGRAGGNEVVAAGENELLASGEHVDVRF